MSRHEVRRRAYRFAARHGLALLLFMGATQPTPVFGQAPVVSDPAPPVLESEPAAALARRIHEVHSLFQQWRYDEAYQGAEALYSEHPELPPVQYVAGRAKFYMQDYAGAVELLSQAAEGSSRSQDAYLDFARATIEATRGYVSEKSENFEIRVAPGPDEILIPRALDALERAYANIGADFDYFPERRIVVEAYTRAEDLSAVSGLPVSAIRNTGTVAICKHNKIMFTTPRALLMGYTWLDTLAHEYVHYVVSRVSNNTVPIWLHEGIAKYQETRWRGEAGLALSPYAEGLLASALRGERDFITFEEMHPSMALLPSQEHTSLAFAQVFSVVEYIVMDSGGYPALRSIMGEMKAGKDDADAVEAALGVPFDRFQRDWRAWLRTRPMRTDAHARLQARTYADGAERPGPSTAKEDLEAGAKTESSKADKHTRLGDLLRMRERYVAAAKQYQKAYEEVGPSQPRLPNRLAVTYMLVGNMDRAEEVLKEAVDPNPNYVTTHVHLGRVYLAGKRWDEAEAAFSRAKKINPFDPEIHSGLLEIHRHRRDEDGIEKASRALALLRQEASGRQWRGRRDQPRDYDATEDRGFLSLNSRPWARVIIDDEDTGMTTPVFRLPVEPGRRIVTLRHEGTGTERQLTIVVDKGEVVERMVTLEE